MKYMILRLSQNKHCDFLLVLPHIYSSLSLSLPQPPSLALGKPAAMSEVHSSHLWRPIWWETEASSQQPQGSWSLLPTKTWASQEGDSTVWSSLEKRLQLWLTPCLQPCKRPWASHCGHQRAPNSQTNYHLSVFFLTWLLGSGTMLNE